jgi:O-methyltransferase involved in polyketide biosynthesis
MDHQKGKQPPVLGEVQETLLIPLYARAVETRKRRGMLSDPRAVEMVEAIGYVIELRRTFFEDTDRRRTLAASITDPSWAEEVLAAPGPYFFAAEAVLIYLEEPQVRSVFDLIAKRFPGALLAAETASALMVDSQDRHDVLSKVSARMRWRCDDPREPARWSEDVELVESCVFSALPAAVRRRLPLPYRAMLRTMAVLYRRQIDAYRFNVYRLGTR